MADSDIENCVSEFASNLHGGASSAGSLRDVKSLLSRQGRAPLEISNTSNCVQSSSRVPNPAAIKTCDMLNSRTAKDRFPTMSPQSTPGYQESTLVDARQQQWHVLASHLEEDDFGYCFSHDKIVPEADSETESHRQAVAAVQDSFRELCAPRNLENAHFFDEIIDVNHEVGFGEDEDFAGQHEVSDDFCDSLEVQPTVPCGDHASAGGVGEEPRQEGVEVKVLTEEVQASRDELVELLGVSKRQFVRSSSTIDSQRKHSGRVESFTRCPSFQEITFHRTISNEAKDLLTRKDQVDDKLNIEQCMYRVDSSVDLTEAVDKQWLTSTSESRDEAMGFDEGQWAVKNRNMQLEEHDGLWKEDGMYEQDKGENYPMKLENINSGNINEVIRDMLAEMKQENQNEESGREEMVRTSLVLAAVGQRRINDHGNPYSLIIMAFEDLLREADGRADRDRKRVEDVVQSKEELEETMRHQHIRWSDTEKQLESQINSLEMQQSRLSDMLRETAAALTLEKERRKESRMEVDRLLDMLKKERKSHQETLEKLNTCVNSLMKLRGNLAMQKSRSAEDGGPSYLQVVETVLRDMDRELQINLNHLTRKSSGVDSHSQDVDELSRWKQHRDALEAERDKIDENMTLLLRNTRERHGEMEALWLERETLLEQKVGCLEVELQHSQMKQRRKEAEIVTERQRWSEELEKCRQAWAHERAAWETTVREKEDRLGKQVTTLDFMSSASEEHSLFMKDSEEFEEYADASGYDTKEMGKMDNDNTARQHLRLEGNSDNINLALEDEFSVDVRNLGLGLETGCGRVTEDLKARDEQWERERMEWKETEEVFKEERQELEYKVSDTLALMEALKMEMKAKECQGEVEKKQVQALLLESVGEVERLKAQLKSKEHDMEVTVQKFMDEVRLIDKEVEKERKEREQVMELHFASKRKVVTDMKEREERWEKELEVMGQELNNVKIEVRNKEKEIEELKRTSMRGPSERERQLTKAVSRLQHEKDAIAAELFKEKGEVRRAMEEMLADVWKVCEEERIQAAVAKRLGPHDDLHLQRPMWEYLWLEFTRNEEVSDDNKSVDWEVAAGHIVKLEKQISEAMGAIESLRNELRMKETHLLEVKSDREKELKERDKGCPDDPERITQQQKERQQTREAELEKVKEAVEKLLKLETDDSAEVISNLQGMVRELEWSLKQLKSPQAPGVKRETDGRIMKKGLAAKGTDLVKVHASYLEEVDRYILELEAKMKVSDKNGRRPEADTAMNLALMEIEKELFSTPEAREHLNLDSADDDGNYIPSRGSTEWGLSGSGLIDSVKRGAHVRVSRPLERNMCLTLNGLATLAQDTWAEGAEDHLPFWQLERQDSLNTVSSWMSPRSMAEDLCASHEFPARRVLAFPPSSAPSTPLRRQQKWVVDVSWLKKIRKEHAWLRQQLEIERQRVAALGQVEADNRWIGAAIIRALELKRESDSKVADMERKVNLMKL